MHRILKSKHVINNVLCDNIKHFTECDIIEILNSKHKIETLIMKTNFNVYYQANHNFCLEAKYRFKVSYIIKDLIKETDKYTLYEKIYNQKLYELIKMDELYNHCKVYERLDIDNIYCNKNNILNEINNIAYLNKDMIIKTWFNK
jgi:hypothetical protein